MSLRNYSTNRASYKLASSQLPSKRFLTKTPLAVAISLALMAGVANAATVSGIKFNDTNANKVYDTGEAVFAGEVLQLIYRNADGSTGGRWDTKTDATGKFIFENLIVNAAGGTYELITATPRNADGTKGCFIGELTPIQFTNVDTVKMSLAYQVPCNNGQPVIPIEPAIKACKTPTISSVKSGNWSKSDTWSGGRIPEKGDTVLITQGHEITVDSPINVAKKEILEVVGGAICNAGTLKTDDGVFRNCAQPATSAANIDISAMYLVNYATGVIRTGNGGSAPAGAGPKGINLSCSGQPRCGEGQNATAGDGGYIKVNTSDAIINEGLVKAGNGGHAGAAHATATGGKGGLVDFASLEPDLSSSVPLQSGDGGNICAPADWWQTAYKRLSLPGDAGKIIPQISNLKGKWDGIGGKSGKEIYYDPIHLKPSADFNMTGFNRVEIYTNEGGEIDFTQLAPGAISAKTIRVSTKASADGKGGILNLAGIKGKLFVATQKVEIYADHIKTDAGISVRDLIDAPEVIIAAGKIPYFVSVTSNSLTSAEPNAKVDIPIQIRNISSLVDTYSIEVTDSAGWQLPVIPNVTVEGYKTKEVNLSITLPAQRGAYNKLTVTVKSQADLSVKEIVDLGVEVNAGVDSDGDTYPDSLDAFSADVKEWRDSDKDDIGNNADTDDDNDGMPDEWEANYPDALSPVLNDAAEDFDKDGASNYDEFKANTDPTDANSKPVVVKPKVDLWVADPAPDDGTEPGKASWIWFSPNVWVRNQNDGGTSYQNPIYGQDNYVHVKVKNRGTLATSKPAKVEVYRSGASMGRGWPNGWDLVGTATIDALDAGKETTVVVKWDKDRMAAPGHYCFYVRVLSDEDGMFTTETNDLVWNTQQNNNVAWRNFDVVGLTTVVINTFQVNVGNSNANAATVSIVFDEKENLLKNDGSKVIVDLGADLFKRWQQAGAQGENIKVLNGTEIQLLATPAKFVGIELLGNEQAPITMRVEAFKPAPGAGTSREYHFSAQEFIGEKLIGGVDYTIITRAQDTDSDGDGVKDVVDNDNDNDGVSDEDEVKAGTNPLDAKSIIVNKTYKASGVITDDLGQAIAGVIITMNGKSAQTDEQGKWEITGLIEGDYTIIAEKEGYAFSQQKFSVGNDSNATVKFAGTPLLKAEVVAKPAIVEQGNEVIYLIKVRNTGTVKATNVVMANTLPVNLKFVSFKAAEGIVCDDATASCTIAEIAANSSVTIELTALAENSAKTSNTVTLSSENYPTDVVKTTVEVLPYLSVTGGCTPNPVPMLTDTRCTLKVNISSKSPEDAKAVVAEFNFAEGIEFKSVIPAECDSSQLPKVLCNFGDMAIGTSKEMIVEGNLTDGGLLYFVQSASVSASNYDAYGIKLRNEIYIPPEVQADIAIVIDVTGSMQGEIDAVKKALEQFIKEIPTNLYPQVALIVFKDEVRVKAFTKDLAVLLNDIKVLKAEGGGACPEASVEALLKAIPHVKSNGTILFYTDASPYPDADIETLLAQLKAKNIRIHPVITGDCTSKDSWNSITK